LPGGRVINQQLRSIDILPTITEFLDISSGNHVQGLSFLPAILDGRQLPNTVAYMETLSPQAWMGWSELRAVRTSEWKFILAPRPELYQLETDPSETQNVLESRPDVVNRLSNVIKQLDDPGQQLPGIEVPQLSEQSLRELRALGYLGAGNRPELILKGNGPDPKDRLHVLQVLSEVAPALERYQFEEAIPLLENLVKEDPSNPMLFQMLGFCFQKTRQLQRARQTYQQAIANGAETPRTYTELGEILVQLEEWDQAVRILRQAEKAGPLSLQNLRDLTVALLRLGQREAAAERVREIQVRFKGDPAGQELLGFIEADFSDPEKGTDP
jgi:tetratricopeptide (TPR) repeat protein